MKLDRIEALIIVLSVWAAAFLISWSQVGDWARALGGSIWALLIGWATIGTINARRKRKAALSNNP